QDHPRAARRPRRLLHGRQHRPRDPPVAHRGVGVHPLELRATAAVPPPRPASPPAATPARATPRLRTGGSVYTRLSSGVRPPSPWLRQPAQPTGAPSRYTTRNAPSGGSNSAGSTGVSSPLLP